MDIANSARDLVGVKEVMVSEAEVGERNQICAKLILLVAFTKLALGKTSSNMHRGQASVRKQDYSLLDMMAQVKLTTYEKEEQLEVIGNTNDAWFKSDSDLVGGTRCTS